MFLPTFFYLFLLYHPPPTSLNYFLNFIFSSLLSLARARALAYLKSLSTLPHPSSPCLNLFIGLYPFWILRCEIRGPGVRVSSLFSILHESSSRLVLFVPFLLYVPGVSLSRSSLGLVFSSLPPPSLLSPSRRLVLVHADLADSLLRTAFLRYDAIRRSRAAGGTEKRRP